MAKSTWFKDNEKLEENGDDSQQEQWQFQYKGKRVGKSSRRLENKQSKNSENKVKTSTVMFISWTKKGKLIGRLKEEEDRLASLTGFRIKFQEEGGTPLWRQFSTRLETGLQCGRNDCVTCKQDDEKRIDCFARSVVYESKCQLCHMDGKDEDKGMIQNGYGAYTGETSRSVYERTKEHLRDAVNLERESHMTKHWFLDHPNEVKRPRFKFQVVGQYRDCLTRQVKEAVRLSNRPGNLNSKGEFGGCYIPRLTIEKTDYETKKLEIEEKNMKLLKDGKWDNFVKDRRPEGELAKKRKLPLWMLENTDPLKNNPSKRVRRNENEHNKLATSPGEQIDLTDPGTTSPPNNQPGVLNTRQKILGGKKGKGPALMSVLSLKTYFKDLATPENWTRKLENVGNITPKRKNEKVFLASNSPAKKLKFELDYTSTRDFWEATAGIDQAEQLKVDQDNLRVEHSGEFGLELRKQNQKSERNSSD